VLSGVELEGRIIWDDDSPIADLTGRTFFLMPLQKAVTLNPEILGLLLQYVGGNIQGEQYRRVAYYEIWHERQPINVEITTTHGDKPIKLKFSKKQIENTEVISVSLPMIVKQFRLCKMVYG
jgi:hypothetical protein